MDFKGFNWSNPKRAILAETEIDNLYMLSFYTEYVHYFKPQNNFKVQRFNINTDSEATNLSNPPREKTHQL